MPLWLTRSDVESLLDMPAAIEAVADAYRLIYLGQAELPVRSNIPVARHAGSLMTMPAYLGGDVDALGAKLITFYDTNPAQRNLPAIQGKIVLFDPETGALQAFIEAGLLTAMRTGAAGGVAARYLARADARTLTIFGSGAQAPYQVEAVLCERAIERVLVLSPPTFSCRDAGRPAGAALRHQGGGRDRGGGGREGSRYSGHGHQRV